VIVAFPALFAAAVISSAFAESPAKTNAMASATAEIEKRKLYFIDYFLFFKFYQIITKIPHPMLPNAQFS
jgi:hypothetical protein